MDRTSHISDADLILFENRELSSQSASTVETHLEHCPACQSRLKQLQEGISAYRDYRKHVLQPSLPQPAAEWPSLCTKLAEIDREKEGKSFSLVPKLFWVAVAFASALLVTTWYFSKGTQQPEIRQLLTESAALPPVPHARLLLTANGRHWSRPAVLRSYEEMPATADHSTLDHIQTLFIKAHYNWEDPLSARSFAQWRNQLPEKQDQVTTVRDEAGRKCFYRLQTRTSASILHTASLTLRADTSRAVNAAFEFVGKENIEMAEQSPDMEKNVRARARNVPVPYAKTTETLATPEDELRVFAALNAIGDDGEDPIEVNFDQSRQHVLVTGIGLSPARRKEVEEALKHLPNTLVNFDSTPPAKAKKGPDGNTDIYSADVNPAFHQILESKAGGAQQLQLITDRALEASNKLFAQSHALLVLAQKFPPAVEGSLGASGQGMLRALRQRHAFALEQTVLQLGEALKPLLNSSIVLKELPDQSSFSWQRNAVEIFENARNLDGMISRLLAGYSEEAGEKALIQLPHDLGKAEQLARAQATGSY